ncbi:hypothetical protein ADEAN_000132500 [Angomonas deanei]|uniref:Uncharacterized protein n=1 Tax=Angomonas deanei TaxID=59799 RepID=A0A7G2C7C8_9TRYP|nr:hypothetical protein ADEAN_000132500 [Angomonas deanei]
MEEQIRQQCQNEFHSQLKAVQQMGEQQKGQLEEVVGNMEKELAVQKKVSADLEEQLNVALTGQQESQRRVEQLERGGGDDVDPAGGRGGTPGE